MGEPLDEALASELALWEQRSPTARLDLLLQIWRAVPDPLVASLLTLLSAQLACPPDLDRLRELPHPAAIPLLAPWLRAPKTAATISRRLERLFDAYAPDPRLVDLLVTLLKHPIPRSTDALNTQILDYLEAQQDPRLQELLKTVPNRNPLRFVRASSHPRARNWKPNRQNLAFNERLQAQITRPAHPRRLVSALRKQIGTIANTARAVQRYGTASREARRLLEQIVATPDEDAPRLVFADLLSTRGDPRGELIVLQIAHAQKKLDTAGRARVRALLDAHASRWLAPVAAAIRPRRGDFIRGFLTRVRIVKSDLDTLRQVASSTHWWTVEDVDLHHPRHLAFLLHVRMPALRRVSGLAHPEQLLTLCARFPRLRSLSFIEGDPILTHPEGACPLERLTQLTVTPVQARAVPWMLEGVSRPLNRLRLEARKGTWTVRACIEWLHTHRGLARQRAELWMAQGGSRIEVHTGFRAGRRATTARMTGALEAQRTVIAHLRVDEVFSLRSDSEEIRALARTRFPEARIQA